MIETFARLMIRLKWIVVVLLPLLFVMGLGYGGQFLKFTSDYRVFFSGDNPQLQAFDSLQESFTKNDNVLFMLLPEDGNVFTPKTLEAVQYLTEKAWETPYSIRVDSISNFQHTFSEEDDLIVLDLVEDAASLDPADLQRIREIALQEPVLVNNLISPDGKATGINVTVELPGVDETTEVPEVAGFVRKIRADFRAQYPNIPIYMTGVAEMNNAFAVHAQNDIQTLVPLALLFILGGILIVTRSISGTLATFLLVLLSVIAAMGSAGWMGIQLTGPSVSAPTMIMTLAVADSIHFLITMLLSMRRGMPKYDAIVESLRINFAPIFLTSVTTIIGFLSLNFSDSPPFHDLGNITAMGVGYAFILSVTFLPALMAVLPVRVKVVENKDDTGSLKFISRVADFSIHYQKPLMWLLGGVSLFFVAMVTQNELNDNFLEYFDETVEFRQDTDKVTDNLTGMYLIEFAMDSGQSGGISSPAFLSKLESFGDWLGEQPEVLHVNILTDVFKRLNKNLHGDDPSYYKIPQDRELAAQYLLLYEMSLPYGLDLNNQINVDKSKTRVTAKLQTMTSKEVLQFEQRILTWFDDNAPELSTYGVSPTVIFSHLGMRNIKSMIIGTTIALLLISVLLIFALRSVRIGLLSIVPNLLPVGVAFGIWGLLEGEIGLALSVVAGMTLGVVVDDTVHFLSKYLRARRERQLEPEEAIRYAFSTVGVALTVNTVVLVAGFLVLATSHFKVNADMGLLTAITIFIALVADFLLLPALLMKIDRGQHAPK